MKELINEPTRVTQNTSTLIDVILTTCPSKHISSGVFKSTLSDHYMVYTEMNMESVTKGHNEVKYRNYTNFVLDDFINDCQLLNHEFMLRYNSNDNDNLPNKLEVMWDFWKKQFLIISDKHAPFRVSRMKVRKNKWITSEIQRLINKRDYLHKRAIKSNDVNRQNILWEEYRKIRNQVTKSIKKSKLKHFENITDSHKNNPKQFWKEMRSACPTKSKQKVPDISPDEFNTFFANIGNDVVKTIKSDKQYKCSLSDSIHQFRFVEVSPVFIKKRINKLSLESKNDIFSLDSKLLRLGSDYLTKSITLLVNMSLKSGHCPLDWKLARVAPAYKEKGDFLDKNNFRPLSVIGHIALLSEKCVQKQLLEYLILHKFISIDQFAYLSKHSTQTCLHRLIDDILENINEKEKTALCFLDIRKCFDTIDHHILLTKLQKYGIRHNELKWFTSYLQSRQQVVVCNSKVSSKENLNLGVPQGTVLGPILFLLFVNDLSNNVSKANINIYADDVVIYTSNSDVKKLQNDLQTVMNDVNRWYKENKLVLSLEKCNTMIINSNNSPDDKIKIYLDNTLLQQVSSVKYLGLTIDNKLKWTEHTLNIVKKININNSKIRRLSNILPQVLRKKIHTTFSIPSIDYAATVWGHFSGKNEKLIDKVEHMAARVITKNYDFFHTRGKDLLESLNFLSFNQRTRNNIAVLMFKAIHNNAPDHIINKFTLNSDIHKYSLRSTCNLSLATPLPRCEYFKHSLAYLGPIIWNSLPDIVKRQDSLSLFKQMYKRYVLTDTT